MKKKTVSSLATPPDEKKRLIANANRGGMTLVLGAGISIASHVPGWNALAKAVWEERFPDKKSPWSGENNFQSPLTIPQFLPMVFELVFRNMEEEKFKALLKKHLYKSVAYPLRAGISNWSNNSLAIIAEAIVQEFGQDRERGIDSVITLNADDLLEQAVHFVAGIDGQFPIKIDPIKVYARSMHSFVGAPLRQSIPVYHIHGFLPSDREVKYLDSYDHMLIFTDTQYWATSASSFSFANRVMSHALAEGRCVFIGLSMTDINLLRWMGLRSYEEDQDMIAASKAKGFGIQSSVIKKVFDRHYWIRTASDDPTGFLSDFLKWRGISSIEIRDWEGDSFRKLMAACFPAKRKAHKA